VASVVCCSRNCTRNIFLEANSRAFLIACDLFRNKTHVREQEAVELAPKISITVVKWIPILCIQLDVHEGEISLLSRIQKGMRCYRAGLRVVSTHLAE